MRILLKLLPLLLVVVLALSAAALADAPEEPYIPSEGVVTIPDQPVPIVDAMNTPATGEGPGPAVLITIAFICLSVVCSTAVRKREK